MIRYESYDVVASSKLVDTVIVPLYEDVYADVLADPFDSTERFTERVRSWLSRPTFAMVAAYAGDEPVGQAFGTNLTSLGPWDKMLTPLPDGFADEYGGTRTFCLTEIMVREPWRRQGIARQMHDMLLSGRTAHRAILTVRQDNDAAHAAYASWGWRKVGLMHPFPDAPIYDTLLLPLADREAPLHRHGAVD